MGDLSQDFLIAEASNEVIVHQSSRLHVRRRDRRADKAESPLLEILAQCLGFGGSRWNLSRSFPAAEFPLRANIAETLLASLITEQGGKDIQHEEHEEILFGPRRRAQ